MRLHIGFCFWMMLLPIKEVCAQSFEHLIEDGSERTIPAEWNTDPSEYLTHNSFTNIAQWYSSKGYFSAKVSFSTDTVFVEKGCRYKLTSLGTVAADGSELPDLPEYYSESEIERSLNSYIKYIVDQGYLFATASIDSIDLEEEECEVSLYWSYDRGEQIVVNSFRVNKLSDDENVYLNRRARFRDSTVVDKRLITDLKNDLIRTDWFFSVRDPAVFKVDDRYMILVEAEKRPSTDFEGILGYVPSPDGEGQIVGDLNLNVRNAFALGNRVGFTFQRIRPETSELDVNIAQDWISDIPLSLSSNFYFYQNDTTYQARNFRFGAAYEFFPGFHLLGELDLQNTIAGNNDQLISEPDGSKQTAMLGFRISTVDNTEVPTRGSLIEVSLGRAYKDIENDSLGSFRQNVLRSSVRKFIPLRGRNILAVSAYGFFLDADVFTLHDLIRFGGANSLRGYSEQQFRASLMLWSDLEYRYMTDPFSYLFLFGSFGGYQRPELITEESDTFAQEDYLYSFGFGLSYRIAIGRIKFSYAISPQDAISNGKVHIGIKTAL